MSFVEDGRPNPDSQDEVMRAMMDSAEEAFGRGFSRDEAVILSAFFEPAAEYFAEQQDELAEVLDSAQIDYAEGEALDLLAELIGVDRLEAQPATTVLQFQHDTPVTRDYTIPEGTTARTDSVDAVNFETVGSVNLMYLDGFEDNDISEYTGDTGTFNVQTGTVKDGTYALEAAASTGKIYNRNVTINPGSRIHEPLYLNANTAAGFLFGGEDVSNNYGAVVDASSGEIRLEVTENGATSTIASTSTTIPTGEFLEVIVDWKPNARFEITVNDASGSEVDVLTASEPSATFETGGYGFQSLDSNDVKYIDEVSMSRAGVLAEAAETGSQTNVGANTLTVLASATNGVDSVTNPIAGSGGRDREEDDNYRIRAKQELSSSLRATLPALLNRIRALEDTRSVTIVENDENSTDADGRPGHSFEPIVDVDPEAYTDVAETILHTKAAGDTCVGGYAGTSVSRTLTLDNGQDKTITFSVPGVIDIHVSVELTKTADYSGDEQVKDSIAQYIGGSLADGANVSGELGAGDDVIYNQVLEAVMNVDGVHDVTTLNVGTSDPPSGTSNVTITDSEDANVSAMNDISVTSSDA